uniref:Platelet-derived growth factor receptor-like protein n=1 Tax=Lepeophtheirus salmonis TaxID=72036 RepID=A0A0K2U975_LEPSM
MPYKFLIFVLGFIAPFTVARSPRYVPYDPPRVIPNAESQTVRAATSYTFRCEGDGRGVTWIIPSDATMNLRSRLKLTHITRGNRHISSLNISDLIYTDTGTYICVYNGTRNIEQATENVTSMHLYVSDDAHLLKKSGFEFLRAIQSEAFVIKCLPTHPEVDIILEKESVGRVDNRRDYFISYDPRVGFTINPVMLDIHSGTFKCGATHRGKVDEYTASLNVLVKTSFVPRPHINKTLTRHISVGKSFKLSCSVTVDLEVLVQLSWRTPNSKSRYSGRLEEPNPNSRNLSMGGTHLKIVEQSLIIHDATLDDQGSYECKVTDHSKNTQTTREFVHILKEEESYLRIYYDGYQTIERGGVELKRDDPVQWVVHIEAYPKPNVTWFGPDGKKIAEYGRRKRKDFAIDTFFGGPNERTMLQIKNLAIDKAGNYSVRVQNEKHVKVEHFELVISVEPKVELFVEDFYGGFFEFSYEYTIKCSGTGSPTPDVNWLFQSCSSYNNCEGSENAKVLTNFNNRIREVVHTQDSTLKIVARKSGRVICQSCNSLDCETKIIPFFVTDIKNGFNIYGPSKVIEGQPFELTCSASIYNFTDVEWFKHEVAGEDRIISPLTDANLLITSRNSELSFSKVLRFKNASLSDHGRYYCKAYSRDGRIRSALHADLTILPLELPKISMDTNMKGERSVVEEPHSGHEFYCPVYQGRPHPKIQWTLNGLNISSPRAQILEEGQLLKLNYITEVDEGLYVCSISNQVGAARVNQVLILQSSLDKDFFYSHISIPVIVAVSVALLLVAALIIGAKLCFLRKSKKSMAWKAPPTPPTPRLTQFDLPVDDGECNEVCRLTNNSRDATPSEADCRCSLSGRYPQHSQTLQYPSHRNVIPYYSNCSVCDYSIQTLPLNHMMRTLPRNHYDANLRSPSPSKLSAEF